MDLLNKLEQMISFWEQNLIKCKNNQVNLYSMPDSDNF